MQQLLKQLSLKALELNDFDYPTEMKQNLWLGYEPALETQIKETEQRLGVTLPNDYKQFLAVSNGFAASSGVEPTFITVDAIDYLRYIDKHTIEAYSVEGLEDVGEALQNAILIAGDEEDQYFLLIPPYNQIEEWRYWKFANWIPGEEEYTSLYNYFETALDFINEELEFEEE